MTPGAVCLQGMHVYFAHSVRRANERPGRIVVRRLAGGEVDDRVRGSLKWRCERAGAALAGESEDARGSETE